MNARLLGLGAVLLVAGVAVVAVVAATGTEQTSRPAVSQTQRVRAEEPPVIESRNGLLRTTFTVEERSVTIAGARVRRAKTYQGELIGPTLRVKPGDTIEIRLVNRLGEPTNLHLHGFHVSPRGIADNVLRVMPPGTDNIVRVKIHRPFPPGTYWYHSHMHGRTEEQIASGLSGVIVVDSLAERLPRALRNIPDRVIALKDAQIRDGAIRTTRLDIAKPTTRTVNGLVDPVLRARTNQTQLLRLANISSGITYRLQLDGVRFAVIAEDANPVGRVWRAAILVVPPGKRYDVLVRWPRPGTYRLRTLRYQTGPGGDSFPKTRLATVRVEGRPVAHVAWPRALGAMPQLGRARIARVRHFTLGEHDKAGKYFINGNMFNPRRVDTVSKLGAYEEWVVRNATSEDHPFHIHVNDFQVMSINGRPYGARGLQDTVNVPARGVARLRTHLTDFVGPVLYHCHIGEHEDGGMMGLLQITRTGRRAPLPSQSVLGAPHAAHADAPTGS
jgi:suppressor of ftsI